MAAAAVATLLTGDDLFGDDLVARAQTVFFASAFTKGEDFADEFMAGDDRGLAIACAVLVSPEKGGAKITF